jgi:translocator protein
MTRYWNGIRAVAFCELVGFMSAFFTAPAIAVWYATLEKSSLTPPDWIFGPTWIILYALMGIALALVWNKGFTKPHVNKAIGVFFVQLFLNFLWSILFFGLHNPALALIDILLLTLSILWTIILFYKISRMAAYLLIPYFLWVVFATYLNYAIWMLN